MSLSTERARHRLIEQFGSVGHVAGLHHSRADFIQRTQLQTTSSDQ